MGRFKNHRVWDYFDQLSESRARCKECSALLSCSNTSANLVRHMYRIHDVDASHQGADRTGFLMKVTKKRRRKGTHREDSLEPEMSAEPSEVTDPLSGDDTKTVLRSSVKSDSNDKMPPKKEFNHLPDEDLALLQVCEFSMSGYNGGPQVQGPQVSSKIGTSSTPKVVNNPTNKVRTVTNVYQVSKLKAEARYYNEMADLAHAKRLLVELETEKIQIELRKLRDSV